MSTTIELNNKVVNGNFANGSTASWTTNTGTVSVALDNAIDEYVAAVDGIGTSANLKQYISVTAGHKYYVRVLVSCSRYTKGRAGVQLGNDENKFVGATATTNGYQHFSRVVTVTVTGANSQITVYYGSMGNADLSGRVGELLILDLTEIFGEGHEPSVFLMDTMAYIPQNTELSWGQFYRMMYTVMMSRNTLDETEARAIFMKQMNRKAQMIGMSGSRFSNSTGLYAADQTTTAYDVSLLTMHAAGFDEICKTWGAKKADYVVFRDDHPVELSMNTTILDSSIPHYVRMGGKTGTLSLTPPVYNLTGMFRANDGSMYVANVLGATNNSLRYASMQDLLDAARLGREPDIAAAGCVLRYDGINPLLYTNSMPTVLASKDAAESRQPASITKLLTAIMLLESVPDLNTTFQLVPSDIKGGSGPLFYAGDVITFRDALYLMLLPSSNTIAHAISRVVGNRLAYDRGYRL